MLEAAPEEFVIYTVALAASSVSLVLASVGPGAESGRGGGVREVVGKVELQEVLGKALVRRFNHSVSVGVGAMEAEGASARGGGMAQVVAMDEDASEGPSLSGLDAGLLHPFLAVGLEIAPRDGGFAHAVSVQMRRVKLVHRRECFEALLAWSTSIRDECQRSAFLLSHPFQSLNLVYSRTHDIERTCLGLCCFRVPFEIGTGRLLDADAGGRCGCVGHGPADDTAESGSFKSYLECGGVVWVVGLLMTH